MTSQTSNNLTVCYHYRTPEQPGGVHGFLWVNDKDSACIDLVVRDTATGDICRKTICFLIPDCDREVPACDKPGMDSVLTFIECDSVDASGKYYVYWRVALDSMAGDWLVYAISKTSILSNVVPDKIGKYSPFIGGYASAIPAATDTFCVDLILINPVTMEVCIARQCTPFPCNVTGYFMDMLDTGFGWYAFRPTGIISRENYLQNTGIFLNGTIDFTPNTHAHD